MIKVVIEDKKTIPYGKGSLHWFIPSYGKSKGLVQIYRDKELLGTFPDEESAEEAGYSLERDLVEDSRSTVDDSDSLVYDRIPDDTPKELVQGLLSWTTANNFTKEFVEGQVVFVDCFIHQGEVKYVVNQLIRQGFKGKRREGHLRLSKTRVVLDIFLHDKYEVTMVVSSFGVSKDPCPEEKEEDFDVGDFVYFIPSDQYTVSKNQNYVIYYREGNLQRVSDPKSCITISKKYATPVKGGITVPCNRLEYLFKNISPLDLKISDIATLVER